MKTSISVSVCIMAGGASSRMGRSKAQLDFLSEPLMLRLLTRLNPLTDEIFISANDPEGLAFLKVPIVPDRFPGEGPLGGLLTALEYARRKFVIVLACDMPFVSVQLLQAELALCKSSRSDAVIPITDRGPEPLHAVYLRENCVPLIRAALDSGKERLISWTHLGKIRWMTQEEILAHDPKGLSLFNVNTPRDLDKAEKIERMQEQDGDSP